MESEENAVLFEARLSVCVSKMNNTVEMNNFNSNGEIIHLN